MGKRIRGQEGVTDQISGSTLSKSHISSNGTVPLSPMLDPVLAQLFASSSGPVKVPSKSRYDSNPVTNAKSNLNAKVNTLQEEELSQDEDDENLSSVDGDIEDTDITELLSSENEGTGPSLDKLVDAITLKYQPKRKRQRLNDDVEERYMQKLAMEEEKENNLRQVERKLKRQKSAEGGILEKTHHGDHDDEESHRSSHDTVDDDSDDENNEGGSDSEEEAGVNMPSAVPLHESLAPDKDAVDLEKASRTVFLSNVSTSTITSKADKKALLAHLGSFIPSLSPAEEGRPAHKVESIRFRSTAYAGNSLPRKAAFAKKNLMEATTKSTNAYVVYSSAVLAREAPKRLNGTIVLGRHLRVDSVAHPAKVDHRRCVFVGNLGFVDDESLVDQGGENERKRSKIPSDVEEGLWRQFGKAGRVESVRVIRDEKTRVGKGFAYVQFQDGNAVEEALLYNGKKFPPMLPRILRVVRAKAVNRTSLASHQHSKDSSATNARSAKDGVKGAREKAAYNPKISSQEASLQGRAGKLLGKSGAAQFRKNPDGSSFENRKNGPEDTTPSGARNEISGKNRRHGGEAIEGIAKTPGAIIFEGFRATSSSGKPKDLKLGHGGGGKKKGKPRTRVTKRTSEWRKGNGKK